MRPQQEANANLIAAAPTMAEAIRETLELWSRVEWCEAMAIDGRELGLGAVMRKLHDALALAERGPQRDRKEAT